MENEDQPKVVSVKSSTSNNSIRDKALDLVTDALIKMPDVPKEERLERLTDEQKQQIQEIQDCAIRDHRGQIDELESALGMLHIGHHFGWKVLYLIHSKKTVRKYEDILGIKIREFFPERGPSSPRSVGLAFADKVSNFWKVVSGDIKIPDRRKVE